MCPRTRKAQVKTQTRKLEPGKWRFQIQAGQEVTGVRLVGMRNRAHPLLLTEKADFHSRLMKRPNGEVSEAAILRGVPTNYLIEGPWLMIWPSPAHNWIIEYDTVPREKAA